MTHQPTINFFQKDPSPNIEVLVMERIKRYDSRRFKIRVAMHSIITIGAGIAMIPTISYLLSSASDSGLMSYISLIWSDGQYLASNINDFAMSVASSWPIMASILVLGTVIVFLNSLQKIIRYSGALSFNRQLQIS